MSHALPGPLLFYYLFWKTLLSKYINIGLIQEKENLSAQAYDFQWGISKGLTPRLDSSVTGPSLFSFSNSFSVHWKQQITLGQIQGKGRIISSDFVMQEFYCLYCRFFSQKGAGNDMIRHWVFLIWRADIQGMQEIPQNSHYSIWRQGLYVSPILLVALSPWGPYWLWMSGNLCLQDVVLAAGTVNPLWRYWVPWLLCGKNHAAPECSEEPSFHI